MGIVSRIGLFLVVCAGVGAADFYCRENVIASESASAAVAQVNGGDEAVAQLHRIHARECALDGAAALVVVLTGLACFATIGSRPTITYERPQPAERGAL